LVFGGRAEVVDVPNREQERESVFKSVGVPNQERRERRKTWVSLIGREREGERGERGSRVGLE
tara:strand:+ start:22550 stop:22738 length:189 start_codon:yes stop_codon:yes gene_type:complete